MVLHRDGTRPVLSSVSAHPNRVVGCQRDFENLTAQVNVRQLSQGVPEQARLDGKVHEAVRHVHADQTGMVVLPLHQWSKIRPVVRHEHIPVPDRTPESRSQSFRDLKPEPVHVRRFRKPPFSSDCSERGTQTFVDEKLHRLWGNSRKSTSLDTTGFRLRQKGPWRLRPRRG